MNPIIVIGFIAGGIVALLYSRAQAAQAPADSPSAPTSGLLESVLLALPESIANPIESITMDWKTELDTGRGQPYAAAFQQAETVNALPPYLVARMAWQESRYRPDIIFGRPNAVGAVGILQIIPAQHPGIDATDPFASIAYAGRWMQELYRQFGGSWALALMAYNWGPGNVNKYLSNGGAIPKETDSYYSEILSDVSTVNGVTYA